MSDNQDPHAGQPVRRAGVPVERAKLVAIFIHGRGASAADILSLADELRVPDVAYLAPQAAGSILVSVFIPHADPAERTGDHVRPGHASRG